MKPIHTDRLLIRDFRYDDLGEIYRILDVELKYRDASGEVADIEMRKKWLDWTIKGYEMNNILKNPPLGDYAIILRENMQLIGACGYVPVLARLGSIPYYRYIADVKDEDSNYSEIGLFCAISLHYHCRGFAYEASSALIDNAFSKLKLNRIIALTNIHNNPSIAVMKRLDMKLDTLSNGSRPQIVGILENTTILKA